MRLLSFLVVKMRPISSSIVEPGKWCDGRNFTGKTLVAALPAFLLFLPPPPFIFHRHGTFVDLTNTTLLTSNLGKHLAPVTIAYSPTCTFCKADCVIMAAA